MSAAHHIAPRDRIPLLEKVAFGLGMAVPIVLINSVAQLTNLIFNLGMGISVIWLGIAQMVPRLWDAISDPLTGHISDNTRTRWGRRRPFVVVGGVLSSLFYVLIWWVPADWSKEGIMAYYLAATLFFYTATTIFAVPLTAMGYEMSRDYHEKTRLFAFGSFFGNVFAIVTPWMYALANSDWFDNEVEGMRWVSLFVGVAILTTSVLPGIVCRERHQLDVKQQARVRFWPSMGVTLRDMTFLRVVGVVVLVTAGFNFVNNFTNYNVIFYVYGGNKNAADSMLGINGTVWAITALLAVFPMTLASERLGKARTVQLFVVLMVAGSFAKIVCYNPAIPLLTVVPTVLIAAGMLALYTMAWSMIGDVCNLDELKTGYRREGSYSAVYSWWLKVAISLGFFLSGYLLNSTGFDSAVVEQSAHTLFWMRFWEITLPGLLSLVAVLLLHRYPLTEQRAYEIKAQLEAASAED